MMLSGRSTQMSFTVPATLPSAATTFIPTGLGSPSATWKSLATRSGAILLPPSHIVSGEVSRIT